VCKKKVVHTEGCSRKNNVNGWWAYCSWPNMVASEGWHRPDGRLLGRTKQVEKEKVLGERGRVKKKKKVRYAEKKTGEGEARVRVRGRRPGLYL